MTHEEEYENFLGGREKRDEWIAAENANLKSLLEDRHELFVEHCELSAASNSLRDDITKLQAENANLRGTISARETMDNAICARLGLPPFGCDTADHLADDVEALRKDRDRLRAGIRANAGTPSSDGPQ